MNNFELTVWDDDGNRCTFYSVLKEDHFESEADKFLLKFSDPAHPNYQNLLDLTQLVTEVIGNKYGATDDFFNRPENKAFALPPKIVSSIYELEQIGQHFPLRLFCFRINEQIVILFNGGLKESQSVQDSEDLHFSFQEAQIFATRIEKELRSGMIIVAADGRTLTDYRGNPEIIL